MSRPSFRSTAAQLCLPLLALLCLAACPAGPASPSHTPVPSASAPDASPAVPGASPAVPDTTPPTAPTNLSVSEIVEDAITLSWTASTDSVGVAGYDVFNGAILAGSTAATSIAVSGLADDTAYSFTVKARDAAGNVSAASDPVATRTLVAPDVTVSVDSSANRKAISPFIYGYNAMTASAAPAGATFLRLKGARYTTYNWTNNWSNAGTEAGPYSNDSSLGNASNGPAYAFTPTIDDAKARGISALIPIPIQGYVSMAKPGNVPLTSPVADWFIPNVPAKGSAFTLSPNSGSTTVYQDELANFLANRWGAAAVPHFALDNEPDFWGYTDLSGIGQGRHPEAQRTQITYAGLLQKSIASATAIKNAVPGAMVYGPVCYGWNGFLNLQGAIDSDGSTIDQSFIDYYLSHMAAASASRRLLDVLDVHWYPEALSTCVGSPNNNVRIITPGNNSDGVAAARVQAPRSLFDPAYVENSWITQWTTAGSSMGPAIQLIPRFRAKIDARYPGTKFAISEYSYGGEDHPSGAVAQADALGVFGREGLYAACAVPINATHAWQGAAWRAYRNFDGAGHDFGDISVSASTTDLEHVSVYASADSADANRLVLVLIHRPTQGSPDSLDMRSRRVRIRWAATTTLGTAKAFQLAGGAGAPSWSPISVTAPKGNSIILSLPAMSVTTIQLTP